MGLYELAAPFSQDLFPCVFRTLLLLCWGCRKGSAVRAGSEEGESNSNKPFLSLFFHVFDVQITKGRKEYLCNHKCLVWAFSGSFVKMIPSAKELGLSPGLQCPGAELSLGQSCRKPKLRGPPGDQHSPRLQCRWQLGLGLFLFSIPNPA